MRNVGQDRTVWKVIQRMLMLLGVFSATVVRSAEVALSWDPPQEGSNVAGYLVRYGTASGQYSAVTNVGRQTFAVLRGLLGGRRYYFVASSLSASADESWFSNEVFFDVPGPPPQPTGAGNVSFAQNTTSAPSPFWLAGLNGSTNWVLLGESSNPGLISSGGIAFSGMGSNWFVRLTAVPNQRGTAVVSIVATDFVLTNRTSFTAEVTPPNQAPVVDAGPSATVRTNLSFMLRGRGTDDGLPRSPGRLSFRWSKVSGPGVVTFGNSNAGISTIRFSAPGLYRLRLTASDGELTSASDALIRAQLISDLTPPVIFNVSVLRVTSTEITLGWNTDELADEQIKYFRSGDPTPRYTLLRQTPATNHTMTVSNLQPDTLYSLLARSRDPSANQTFSDPVVIRTLRANGGVAPVVASAQPSTFLAGGGYAASTVQSSGELPAAELDPSSPLPLTIPAGWSLIACPPFAQDFSFADLLPDPPLGTQFHLCGAGAQAVQTNVFASEGWLLPEAAWLPGQGGFLFNPGSDYVWKIAGTPSERIVPEVEWSRPGKHVLAPHRLLQGLLTEVAPGIQFRLGDVVHRLRPGTGTYESSTLTPSGWDVIPTINLGEAVILDLAP